MDVSYYIDTTIFIKFYFKMINLRLIYYVETQGLRGRQILFEFFRN